VNRLANSLRVAVKGNQTEELVKQGAELPAAGESRFLTTKALRRGTGGDVINIAVLESVSHLLGKEDRLASGCLHVGTLRILGSDERVTADLPVGSEVEVRLKVDESRAITAVAYVPLLDEQFETVFVGEKFEYEIKDLQQRLAWAERGLEKVKELQDERPIQDVEEVLEALERMKLLASVATDLQRAVTGDRDSEVRAYKRMLEIEGTIRALYGLQNRARIEISIATLRGAVQGDEQRTLNEIQRELSSVQSDEDLEGILESVGALEYAVRGRPWQTLQLDLMALIGQRVTPRQNELFNKAAKLIDQLEEKGGLSKVTDADIVALQQMHSELQDGYPDLYELRNKKLEEFMDGYSGPRELSDLESAAKSVRK
jgi:DnaJ-domain-containing protein 1